MADANYKAPKASSSLGGSNSSTDPVGVAGGLSERAGIDTESHGPTYDPKTQVKVRESSERASKNGKSFEIC